MDAYMMPVGEKKAVAVGPQRVEIFAEAREGDVEAVATGLQVALRPEQLHEHFAWMAALLVVREIGQQRSGLLELEAREGLFAALNAQSAKEGDLPHLGHGEGETSFWMRKIYDG